MHIVLAIHLLFFLEWNIYLILKNHIDRKFSNLTTSLAWIFSWMNFTFSTFSTKKNPVSVLIFVCCVWNYTLPFEKYQNRKSWQYLRIIKPYQHSNLSIFSSKKKTFPHLQWPSVSQVRDQYTWDPNLSWKSVREKKKTARSKASSKLHRLKPPKFLDKDNAIHLSTMFWHLGKFFESDGLTNWQNRWKGFNFTKTLDPTNLISVRKSRHANKKNLEAPKKS